ncbi:MAG TPA: hypothetical protein V6D09_09935 [Leptolyngbyaceae cyanobacterium]
MSVVIALDTTAIMRAIACLIEIYAIARLLHLKAIARLTALMISSS